VMMQITGTSSVPGIGFHKWLRITIGIEDYISQYIWRGFCWHAPWDQLKRLFIRNPNGDQ
jgi:hypothetical protein